MLYMLGADELARTRLPIGEMTKADVRARAHELGLRTASKRESMDVCFITRGGRSAFLGDRIGRRPGAIVDDGRRRSSARTTASTRFTIGQRRGTGVAVGERRYVVDIAPDTATVTVGPRDALLRDRVRSARRARSPHTPPAEVLAQTRAHGAPVAARLDGDTLRVRDAAAARRARPGRRVSTTATCARRRDRRGVDRPTQAIAMRRCRGLQRTRRRRTVDTSTTSASCELGVAAAPAPARTDCGSRSAIAIVPPAVPSRRSSDAGLRSGARRCARRRDLLAAHEHRVGERERIDDHDAGRHEHEPAARRASAATARARARAGSPTTVAIDADDVAAVGEQQRTDARTAPRSSATASGTGPRNSGERDAQREAHLVAVRERVRRRPARPAPTSANTGGDDGRRHGASVADAALGARRSRQARARPRPARRRATR